MAKKSFRYQDTIDTNEEKDWFIWSAPIRAFKRQDRQFWITCLTILALVGVIFFFARDFIVIIPGASALFLYYVMSTVPPEIIENRLTNRGIHFGQAFYPWAIIENFCFSKSADSKTIVFGVNVNFFIRQLSLIINPADQDILKEICLKKAPLVESPPRFIDNLNHRLANLLPFEDKPKTTKTPPPTV